MFIKMILSLWCYIGKVVKLFSYGACPNSCMDDTRSLHEQGLPNLVDWVGPAHAAI